MALHETYGDSGLEIVGFPSKQFGGQEFDSAEEIAKFVAKFNVKFNLGAMTDVNGANSHPVFAWLKGATGKQQDVRWKYVRLPLPARAKLLLIPIHLPADCTVLSFLPPIQQLCHVLAR